MVGWQRWTNLDLSTIKFGVLAQLSEETAAVPLVSDPVGVLTVLLCVLALIFRLSDHPVVGRLFKIVPALVFCYFVPTALNSLGVIPQSSPLYSWVKSWILPCALFLLIVSLDLPAIMRLGSKAVVMLLAGTVGVVVGGPIALLICHPWLPPDVWQGMSALAGSWIGGGANFVAMGDLAGTSETMLATMVIPDVFVGNLWTGVLFYLAARQRRIDEWTGADASAIRDLERRLTEYQERVNRVPSMSEIMMILALGFAGCYLSYELSFLLPRIETKSGVVIVDATTWKYILVTAGGVLLSFTRVRDLEGAGASKIGSVMIYLLVACIGASADFSGIIEQPALIVMGFVWMSVHIIILLGVAWVIKAPIFFVAVGSQANIGGAASAPVVAAAFHPSLAPVGALLAVAGYVLGTYAGLLCMHLLKAVAANVSG